MAKPICVIYIDASLIIPETRNIWTICWEMTDQYKVSMPDYYVFVIPNFILNEPIPAMDFKVYHEKDFTEIQYEELRSIIETQLKAILAT